MFSDIKRYVFLLIFIENYGNYCDENISKNVGIVKINFIWKIDLLSNYDACKNKNNLPIKVSLSLLCNICMIFWVIVIAS